MGVRVPVIQRLEPLLQRVRRGATFGRGVPEPLIALSWSAIGSEETNTFEERNDRLCRPALNPEFRGEKVLGEAIGVGAALIFSSVLVMTP